MAARVRKDIAALDPNAVTEPRTLTSIRRDLADRFMRVVDMVIFLAFVAFVLAVVGIYGAVAFIVSRRTKEIGIRVALGATSADVTRLVLWTGFKPVSIGAGIGLVGSVAAADGLVRVFRDTPIRPDMSDPVAYGSVTMLLVVTGIVAMLGPCRRAASADPVHALHQD
jgi:ABC-type antimicrobial peptide transport system permease subunit